jgi:LAO/AO transport system kinase
VSTTAEGEDLLARALSGERRALAQALSAIERGRLDPAGAALIDAAAGRAYTVGLTGPPGAGKSTLTDALIATERAGSGRIAVLAVDPSSPYSGGAILGDRVRLASHHLADDGVFVRSLASRGHLGGLARAVPDALALLDACGWPTILVETVGVGQTELAIAGAADTTIVVVNPGWGDEVQANKAGLLEVADVLVINKCDRDGVARTRADLVQMLALGGAGRAWTPPIIDTVATKAIGVDTLWAAVAAHRAELEQSGALAELRAERRVSETLRRAQALLARALREAGATGGADVLAAVRTGRIDPARAAAELCALVREAEG